MRYTKIGSTGLEVSAICLGCMSFGDSARGNHAWTLDEDDSRAIVKDALDAGVNFFDTANVYSAGTSEEYLGRALNGLTRRDDVVIATKVHGRMWEGPNGAGLSRKAIMREIDESLRRLGTDHVDLYQIHRFDYATPIEETLEALHDIVKAGKVRYIGASSMYAWQFATALFTAERHGWTRFVSMQNHYNLIYREEEREMLPLCEAQGVGVLPWSPLARGRLTRPWGQGTARFETDEFGKTLYRDEAHLGAAEIGVEQVERRQANTDERSSHMSTTTLAKAGTFEIGGTTRVTRLGYGAMQLTGPGIWGEPKDRAEALRVLRRAVELGVDFIDTADSYGPFISEQLIKEALHPYPENLVIATKAGLTRTGPGEWHPVGRPKYLRQQVELSLRHLGLERIELLQLHRIDPLVPLAEQVGELDELRQEGKIHHIGLSEVSVQELEEAQKTAPIVSVQNLYNLANRQSETLLEHTEANGIAFIPWFPLATGDLARQDGPLQQISAEIGASPSRLALAWLLKRSPVMLPIPGTSTVAHLEDNLAAAEIELTDEQFEALSELGS